MLENFFKRKRSSFSPFNTIILFYFMTVFMEIIFLAHFFFFNVYLTGGWFSPCLRRYKLWHFPVVFHQDVSMYSRGVTGTSVIYIGWEWSWSWFHPPHTPVLNPSWLLSLLPQQNPDGLVGKESSCNAGDPGSIPGPGISPGGENDNPLQYSWLGNPMGCSCPWGHKASGRT